MWKKKLGRPKNATVAICKVDGCAQKISAKQMCRTHYTQSRVGIRDAETGLLLRALHRVAAYAADAECLVDGCQARPKARGMCNRHMIQLRVGIINEQGIQLRELVPTRQRHRTADWSCQDASGYTIVLAPTDHPNARQDGTIAEHRLVMEKMLGRYLLDYEIVHHKNGIRSDNRPNNLEMLDGRAARPSGSSHPPGHDLDHLAAIRVLLQKPDVPDALKGSLELYRQSLVPQ